jgi:hypothetical protein
MFRFEYQASCVRGASSAPKSILMALQLLARVRLNPGHGTLPDARATRNERSGVEGCAPPCVGRQQLWISTSHDARVVTGMARVFAPGQRDVARERFAPMFGWFAEGFDTRDLKEAKESLKDLAAGGPGRAPYLPCASRMLQRIIDQLLFDAKRCEGARASCRRRKPMFNVVIPLYLWKDLKLKLAWAYSRSPTSRLMDPKKQADPFPKCHEAVTDRNSHPQWYTPDVLVWLKRRAGSREPDFLLLAEGVEIGGDWWPLVALFL